MLFSKIVPFPVPHGSNPDWHVPNPVTIPLVLVTQELPPLLTAGVPAIERVPTFRLRFPDPLLGDMTIPPVVLPPRVRRELAVDCIVDAPVLKVRLPEIEAVPAASMFPPKVVSPVPLNVYVGFVPFPNESALALVV